MVCDEAGPVGARREQGCSRLRKASVLILQNVVGDRIDRIAARWLMRGLFEFHQQNTEGCEEDYNVEEDRNLPLQSANYNTALLARQLPLRSLGLDPFPGTPRRMRQAEVLSPNDIRGGRLAGLDPTADSIEPPAMGGAKPSKCTCGSALRSSSTPVICGPRAGRQQRRPKGSAALFLLATKEPSVDP